MSSRQLEARQEIEQAEWVAKTLGVSVEELNEHQWSVEEIDGNDGAVYGYRVVFDNDTDSEFLRKIGTDGALFAAIGFPPEEQEPEDI